MEKLQLDYFLSVAATLNISLSAKELYISQSSLSQTIKRLEQELGYQLFNRTGRHLELNANGKIFYEAIHSMKEIYESALDKIAEQNNILNHDITINMRCASHYLPAMLVYLESRMKDNCIHIVQQNHGDDTEEEADITIYASLDEQPEGNSIMLLKERVLLAVPKDNMLASKRVITTKDLINQKFMGLSSSWELEQEILKQSARVSFIPDRVIEVDNPDVLRKLINKKLGLAFAPERTWKTSLSDAIILKKVEDIPLERYIYMSVKKGHVRCNVAQSVEYICNFFTESFPLPD